jgi:signal recognition particle GTPase
MLLAEKIEDLILFDKDAFVDTLFQLSDLP